MIKVTGRVRKKDKVYKKSTVCN